RCGPARDGPQRPPPRPALARARQSLHRRPRALYGGPDVAVSSLPDGPRAPVALQTLGWLARPTPFSERLRARYGDTFTIRIAGEGKWVMVSSPEAVKQVFTASPQALHTGNEVLLPLLGARSLLLMQESEPLAERRRLLPPFHGERVQAYGELIAEIAEREIATWPAGAELTVRPRMQALTLELIMRAVL